MKARIFNIGGLNLKVSPFLHKDGDLIRSVNVDTSSYGAKKKRPGYITYLGTPDNAQVSSLFNWTQGNGTTFWNYRVSGSILYYSTQGTGAWTVCGNGTLTNGAIPGYSVLNETLIIADGTANTRHTTNGTSFTDTSGAPKGMFLAEAFNRVFIGGTGSVLTYSVTGDPTNWSGTGAFDSSSLTVPGPGRINQVFTANDRINVSKNSGFMFRWDSYSLSRVPTNQGPSSPYSLAQTEDFWFYLNRNGFQGYNGDRPQLISNPIEKQIYNNMGSAVAGTTFNNAPGVTHRYKYLCTVGTTTDDLTNETISDCVSVYDYQNNIWGDYTYANKPTSYLSFKDGNGDQQLIFGAANGQCYQVAGTATSDNGAPIESVMEGVIHLGTPESDKEWKYLWAFFNPGCRANIQVSMGDTFTKGKKKWIDLGPAKDGVVEYRFPSGSMTKLLFWRVYEISTNAGYDFYGLSIEATVVDRK